MIPLRRLVIHVAVAAALVGAMAAGPAAAAPAPRDDTFGGPTDVSGPGASTQWLFAEGTTRAGFDEFILIFNSNPAAVDFTVTYLVDGGTAITKNYTVAASSRRDIKVWQEIGREIDNGTRL